MWDLSEPALASATAQYLVNGGTCPLDSSNVQQSRQVEFVSLEMERQAK
jgi:hypothetical protein